jgi:addiction module HigA family antidote
MSKSSTTTEIPNPNPGEILLAEFIEPMGLSQNALARAIGVPPRRINEIVLGKRAITADTDLRLARYFGLSEGFWLGLQADHDLMGQRRKIEADLARIEPRRVAAE